jgi:chromosome partitioning protein
MAVVIGFVSQKGGTGKSTLARALGALVAHARMKVKIADLDSQHRTIIEWAKARDENRIAPPVKVRAFRTASEAISALIRMSS